MLTYMYIVSLFECLLSGGYSVASEDLFFKKKKKKYSSW